MSIKVYEAYRGRNIFDIYNIQRKLIKDLRQIVQEVFRKKSEKKKISLWTNFNNISDDILLKKINLEYIFMVREYNKHFFIIPHISDDLFMLIGKENAMYLKNSYSHLEEYSFWNNSDKPENIPTRKWNDRGKFWDKVLDESYATFVIIDKNNFVKILIPETKEINKVFNQEICPQCKGNGIWDRPYQISDACDMLIEKNAKCSMCNASGYIDAKEKG